MASGTGDPTTKVPAATYGAAARQQPHAEVALPPPSPQPNAPPTTTVPSAASAPDPSPIIEEFQYLLEKSRQLFAGLRDLTPLGGRQWRPYFQKTFEVYTRLWQFQQLHRDMLVEAYGLKRWEVGEIASKIGQLYYHYYLRTSDRSYLQESYIFYDAIRDREYFQDIFETRNAALVIKLLRYYARFIVVCLLLRSNEMARTLLQELSVLIEDYARAFKASDTAEWQSVVQEITSFIGVRGACCNVSTSANSENMLLPNLQTLSKAPADKDDTRNLRLQEVILVGNRKSQVKFSELTMDMYRMLLTLARRPSEAPTDEGAATTTAAPPPPSLPPPPPPPPPPRNPHKHILFKPTFGQLCSYTSIAFQAGPLTEISEQSALLIYLSADGMVSTPKAPEVDLFGFRSGVVTAPRVEYTSEEIVISRACLYPGDLQAYTRKPLFLVVDSDNSTVYRALLPLFGQPLLCLLSPTQCPNKALARFGSLYTLFLHSPLLAFATVADISATTQEIWHTALQHIDQLEHRIVGLLATCQDGVGPWRRFLQDDFLAQLIARHCICATILSWHKVFSEASHLPCTHPSLPSSVTEAQDIHQGVRQLVGMFGVEQLFHFAEPAEPS
ncbi:protein SCAI [Thamnocephalis sphaerospora]|uniref:Protein SCAI n=1 Tax=Thamnocephalis sphaerospora TaxID=78915 RepID=A0A4P9XW28_9FUNG|nr:protein SCAI [Thamnocephalis sphaerospora]|eukprot:RKP10525.1 protein SCAI [Thamnocephalis sphaerospora]